MRTCVLSKLRQGHKIIHTTMRSLQNIRSNEQRHTSYQHETITVTLGFSRAYVSAIKGLKRNVEIYSSVKTGRLSAMILSCVLQDKGWFFFFYFHGACLYPFLLGYIFRRGPLHMRILYIYINKHFKGQVSQKRYIQNGETCNFFFNALISYQLSESLIKGKKIKWKSISFLITLD